eukprot:CAMPEP_0183318624 /NCGR_PEP_ID=MMETSP0160_2-20130417/61281_1 /TAXON_ID=2839 ORGANISM="Odontella Sinensis, Strain Grunow 1884" /NCGR_SAMPLE_ID=MMETSP0160_2 /ASSEMBLY_ACC=CAM_ASM_000250 /LENGTH=61 /DNA_ID=CAMNT_0025484939 /DNA_START=170 /DNA_END=351 /DNA_ORIENTATION=-
MLPSVYSALMDFTFSIHLSASLPEPTVFVNTSSGTPSRNALSTLALTSPRSQAAVNRSLTS